jgi:hypothetical protein
MVRTLFRILRALAKFSFVDGRRYLRFPDGAVRRVGPKAAELRKTEKRKRRNGTQKATEEDKKNHVTAAATKNWREQVRRVCRSDGA